jgi:hypothetical protein
MECEPHGRKVGLSANFGTVAMSSVSDTWLAWSSMMGNHDREITRVIGLHKQNGLVSDWKLWLLR